MSHRIPVSRCDDAALYLCTVSCVTYSVHVHIAIELLNGVIISFLNHHCIRVLPSQSIRYIDKDDTV